MFVRSVLFMSAALLLGGCEVSTQLGTPCDLVRKATPDEQAAGNDFMPILEKDIAADQDFISFGALDCEDLVCVRDASSPRDPEPTARARGYCSKECVQGTTTGCKVTSSEAVEDIKERMTCRPLLLDQATLEAIKVADEAFYRRTFGENNSPYFCAGTSPQAQGN